MYISVKDLGAYGDSFHDDYAAVQSALDNNTCVYVPAGKYRINGSLKLKSGARLKLHPQAYMILDDGAGPRMGGEGYLLTAYPNSSDISVEGGIWNGNRETNLRVPEAADPYRGILISFTDVSGLHLSHMTVRDSDAFHIRINYVTDFTIEHIRFDDHMLSYCQDGIQVGGGCCNGIIRHIRAVGVSSPNDDLIAFITDFDGTDMSPADPIWGQRDGDIRNIEVYDVEADNAFSFLRLMSGKCVLENIYAHDFRGGCHYVGVQMEINPYIRNRFDVFPPETYYGGGTVRNVTLENWDIYMGLYYGVGKRDYMHNYVGGLIDVEEGVENFVLKNFRRNTECDAKPDTLPTLNLYNFRTNRLTFADKTEDVYAGRDPYVINGSIEYLRIDTKK